MTDFAANSDKQKRKRKLGCSAEKQTSEKKKRNKNKVVDEAATVKLPVVKEAATNVEESQTWTNLNLILSLQNKNSTIQSKAELAYDFVKTWEINDGESDEAVSVSRLLQFLNDWIQSVLIPKAKGKGRTVDDHGINIDIRCWEIFRFCLVEASSRSLSLNFSRYFLRSVVWASESSLGLLNKKISSGVAGFGEEDFDVYNMVLECSTLVFSMHKGVLSDNLDLWLAAVDAVILLANWVFSNNSPSQRAYYFAMDLSYLLLDFFSKYLKIHPCRKNGFQDFVDRLLEPLFHLSGLLSSQDGARKLSKAVNEVLSQGLFHNVHVDGFLNFGSTEQYVESSDAKHKEQRMNFKSYHKHLFGKLEKIIGDKKVSLFGGVNILFQLLIQRVKIQRCASSPSKDAHLTANNENIKTDSSSDDVLSNLLSTNIRKSLFDVFAQIMEPLLLQLGDYTELKMEIGPVLLDIYGVLKCINSVVNVLVHEKVYSRTEDTSEGACFDYLKKVYDTFIGFSTKVSHLWLLAYKNNACKHIITLISEELILAVGHLLAIDYKVTGNDLLKLWSMMFSLFAFGSGLGEQDTLSLCARALSLGCQLLTLYCELRQVSIVIVSFCEAIRRLGIHNYGVEFSGSLPCQLYAGSISKLIGSQAFRSALVNAVKSIPEGQASGFVHQIAEDMSDSVEWIKASCLAAAKEEENQLPSKVINMESIYLHLEVFGVGLSEIYSLVLESVSVTSGNSSLIGTSVEKVIVVMRPIMSALVAQQPNLLDFLKSFTGVTPNHGNIASESHLQNLRGPAHFICLFFFRLYLSCRSLYRQAISLVAPKISRKFANLMGDPVSAHSGRELLEINDWTSEGYFSWIVQPSVSLHSVAQFIQQGLLCDGVTASPALTYVLCVMAIHRLVDLNRQLKTLEYLQQSAAYRVQSPMDVEDDLLSGCKATSIDNHISVLRKEALKLVDFLMGHLSLVTEEYSTLAEVQTIKGWDSVISSLNTESLATAIWRIICQNIDVWSIHVTKKLLKKFLTKLICTSLFHTFEDGSADTVNIPNISLELLRNTMLYEQKSIRRHLASRLCVILQKSIFALSSRSGNRNHEFGTSALLEVLASLDKHVANVLIKKASSCEESPQMKQRSQLLSCEGFLGLLCWMPLDYLKFKSFAGLASAVLDLERLVIANIIKTCSPPYEWLSLLAACRRALKHIVMAACENTESFSPFFLMAPDNSIVTLWFLKTISAMSHLSLTFSKIGVIKGRKIFFTLLDHTSAILLNLCKSQVHHILSKSFSKEAFCPEISDEMDQSGDNDAWRNLVTMAETLKNETNKFEFAVSKIKGFNDNVAEGLDGMNLWMNNLSCHLTCVHGFLWGLASALAAKNKSPYETKVQKDKASEVKALSSMFSDFLNRSLQYLLYERSLWPGVLCHTGRGFSNCLHRSPGSQLEVSNLIDFVDMHSYSESDGIPASRLLSEDGKNAANVPCEESQQSHFNMFPLRSLLKDDYPEAAFLLRQLFLAASAGIRLNLHIYCLPTSPSSIHLLTCVSRLVLSELIGLDESLPPFSFIWLDGVLKYLEELGNHFSINKSTQMINDSYNKLIDLLLRVDGKCISLLGKRATLASHETESITKMLDNQTLFTTAHHPLKPSAWNEFKCRLRTSVIGFISNASEQQLLFVIQAVDRALVGVQEGSTIIYEVVTGSADSGRVSSKVAAGVDFLDLVLEHASGRKRLGVLQRHIQRLVSGLFSIIWHLRSPHIFIEQSTAKQDCAGLDPDPGAVALMCTEVLTRIFAKQALFHLNYGHIGQALRLPGALFQSFLHVNHESGVSDRTEASEKTAVLTTLSRVDRKFSIDLYAASCRLLSTVIKHYKECALDMHHKTKSPQSIGVLEDSLSVLLYCLETVNGDLVANGYFSWKVEEGVRLASLLRRVFEEIRQQKDVFGQWVFLFLSHYIQVYSGFGPNRTGIRREIDEALKPGIYALMDACSAEDLQHLHTVFGEGPCRSTLASLRQDYESNFRYVGKV